MQCDLLSYLIFLGEHNVLFCAPGCGNGLIYQVFTGSSSSSKDMMMAMTEYSDGLIKDDDDDTSHDKYVYILDKL